MVKSVALMLSLMLLMSLCEAQTGPASRPATRAALTAEEKQEAAVIYQRVLNAFQRRQFDEAAKHCRDLLKLVPDDSDTHYNLACALARLGKREEAFSSLKAAVDTGYDNVAHMRGDLDLETVRKPSANDGVPDVGIDRFEQLATAAAANLKKNVETKRDKGAEIAGVKMIEGLPDGKFDGGLPWRLRISPDATKEKPHKLIIWMHPSGGSMNNAAEAMSPMFARHGHALLVMTYKSFVGWTSDEAERMLNKTLPHVASKVEAADVRRPVLFGYSAGGQMALFVWKDNPGAVGGLILDAAYPVDPTPQGYKPMALPNDPAVKSTPIFVVVGEDDGGSKVWRKRLGDFTAAEVPTVVHYVPGKPHSWLFDSKRTALLSGWLAEVSAGKMPTTATTAPATQP